MAGRSYSLVVLAHFAMMVATKPALEEVSLLQWKREALQIRRKGLLEELKGIEQAIHLHRQGDRHIEANPSWSIMAKSSGVVVTQARENEGLGGSVAATTVQATHDSIRWQGRTQRHPTNGSVKYSWAGVSFHYSVSGATTTSMVYSSTFPNDADRFGELRVYVNGALTTNITLANSVPASRSRSVVLADKLDSGRSHNISGIYIIDPITMSWPTLPPTYAQTAHAFTTNGQIDVQPPVAPNQRRLDIYGDSITAGNQIDNETCDPDWAGSYGRLLCQDFDANCTCAAISGKGILYNCCDENETMSALGLRLLPSDPTTTMTKEYYASAGKPAGILINLGTNDWDKVKNRSNVSGFVSVYIDFVETLASLHNFPSEAAPVFFLGVGPITHEYRSAVDQIVAAVKVKRIKAHRILYTAALDRCGHPPYDSHVLMYEQARPIISKALGWA